MRNRKVVQYTEDVNQCRVRSRPNQTWSIQILKNRADDMQPIMQDKRTRKRKRKYPYSRMQMNLTTDVDSVSIGSRPSPYCFLPKRVLIYDGTHHYMETATTISTTRKCLQLIVLLTVSSLISLGQPAFTTSPTVARHKPSERFGYLSTSSARSTPSGNESHHLRAGKLQLH